MINLKKQISFVLGSYNRFQFLKLATESIRSEVNIDGTKPIAHEIIVIDGGSDDGALQWLAEQKDIVTIVQHNRGIWQGAKLERRSWGYFMNLGFKIAQGKYICMISDDCLFVPGAVKRGYDLFEQQLASGRNIGAIAFYFRDYTKQEKYYVCRTLGNKMYVNHDMYLNAAIKDVNYIDEESFLFYCADGDLCLKLWHKGYECIDSQKSFVEHYPHSNIPIRKSNTALETHDFRALLKKWNGIFYDPKKDNIGEILEIDFSDGNRTAHQFNDLHNETILSNPEIASHQQDARKFSVRVIRKLKRICSSLVRRFTMGFQ
jgi:glycosyltransferase involved in cell wall biosynthesis